MYFSRYNFVFICALIDCTQIKNNFDIDEPIKIDSSFENSVGEYYVDDFIDDLIDLSEDSINLNNSSTDQPLFINQSSCGSVELVNNNFTVIEYNEGKELIENEFNKCYKKYIEDHSILDELNHERFFRRNCFDSLVDTIKCKCVNFELLIEDSIRLVYIINSNISRLTKFTTSLKVLFEYYFKKELICNGLLKCERINVNREFL